MRDRSKEITHTFLLCGSVMIIMFMIFVAIQHHRHIKQENDYFHELVFLAKDFQLNIHYQTEKPESDHLAPTRLTEELLSRWESVAAAFEDISYPPAEAVERNDWVEVERAWIETLIAYEEIYEASDKVDLIHPRSIKNYIFSNNLSDRDNLKDHLKEESHE